MLKGLIFLTFVLKDGLSKRSLPSHSTGAMTMMPKEMGALIFWPKSSALPTSSVYEETWWPLSVAIRYVLWLFSFSHKRSGIYFPYMVLKFALTNKFRSDGMPFLSKALHLHTHTLAITWEHTLAVNERTQLNCHGHPRLTILHHSIAGQPLTCEQVQKGYRSPAQIRWTLYPMS